MDKTWFITGTSSGFGRELTEQLLARGMRVAATSRNPSVLDNLKLQYSEQLWVGALDVTDTPAVRRVMERAFDFFGRIDVIVNNAGYGLCGAAEEVSDEQIRHQIDTNVIGSIQVIRAALPYLREQGGGRILQLSSEGGQIAYPNFSIYHASKWAIEGFVESIALEVAPFGIEFTLVEPGPTRTGFGSALITPQALEVYDDTPAGKVRRAMASGEFVAAGDPVKMAQAMIASAERSPAPRRLLLGKRAYAHVHKALTERLSALEAQMNIALSADID